MIESNKQTCDGLYFRGSAGTGFYEGVFKSQKTLVKIDGEGCDGCDWCHDWIENVEMSIADGWERDLEFVRDGGKYHMKIEWHLDECSAEFGGSTFYSEFK